MNDWGNESRDSVGSIMEQRLKDGKCMYCGVELWKREYRSSEGGICKGCKKKSLEHLHGYQDYVDNVLLPKKSRITKVDVKAMERYARPVEPVEDDDLPF